MPTERLLVRRSPSGSDPRPCPTLRDAGFAPWQLFGLSNERRTAPKLAHGLEDQRQTELPPAGHSPEDAPGKRLNARYKV